MSPVIGLTELYPRWYEASFAYDPPLIAKLKQIPGAKWEPERKRWKLPHHALPALDQAKIQYRVLSRSMLPFPPPLAALMPKLRPYQQEDLKRMLNEPGFVLAYAPRLGKTAMAAVGIASALASNFIRTAVVMYPNSIKHEWVRQLPQFTMGLQLTPVSGTEEFDPEPLLEVPYLVLGIHYELLRADGKDEEGEMVMSKTVRDVLNLLYRRGRSMAVADEPHLLVKRKSPRAQLVMRIGEISAMRWALTGTPLRNRPRDMFPIWEFVQKNSMGSYSKFSSRYAAGHMGDHGWDDKGRSNEPELRARLDAISIKRTRQEVAPWLPKADRRVILVDMTDAQRRAYAAREAAFGSQVLSTLNGNEGRNALSGMKELAGTTSMSKMGKLLERVRHHVDDRQVKALVFALHHETLQKGWETLRTATERKEEPFKGAIFIAGGWMLPEKRRAAIEQWKQHKSPAVLLVNSLSSGIGIDLSDADVAIGLEASWVPADFIQTESRIEDVHLGKRTTPPLLEYLLARGTIDEDMVSKLIDKLATAEAVTGIDAVSADIAHTLREAGVVDRGVLSLANEDPETVELALDRLRARLSAEPDDDAYNTSDNSEEEQPDEDERERDDDDD